MTWLKQKLKGWRTIATNILFAAIPFIELTEWRNVLPESWLPWYALSIALANMGLRYITTTPMGRSK
ncbi:MAG: hypothetical protein V6Z86_05445 [Hyphomicrobiales bacterium]